jgi:uncharacterized membrane protein
VQRGTAYRCIRWRDDADVNTTALFTMVGIVLGWTVLAGAALLSGRLATFAFLVLTVVALFLYVPWVRLRASGIEGSSRPVRFWTNVAMLGVSLAACLALVVMLARRIGFP